jgi:hypothetical protein
VRPENDVRSLAALSCDLKLVGFWNFFPMSPNPRYPLSFLIQTSSSPFVQAKAWIAVKSRQNAQRDFFIVEWGWMMNVEFMGRRFVSVGAGEAWDNVK